MAQIVLIIGASGSGKSRSIKTFNKGEVMVLKGVNKPFPFKEKGFRCGCTNSYPDITKYITVCQEQSIVLDDFGYNMTQEYMYSKITGYDKYTSIGKNVYDMVQYCMNVVDPNKIVYFIMHEDVDIDNNICKPKTIGKLLDEKVCLEGLFTIVLRCVNESGNHKFYTNNNGCAKSPEEMFESDMIPNDLKAVDKAIREYYGLAKNDIPQEVK